MTTRIGIFAQERDHAGRVFNNLACDYIHSVEQGGGIAIIIPIFTIHLDAYIDECDGFIFSGGTDIDPSLYGQPVTGAREIQSAYDAFLADAMRRIFVTKKPILGICKGMQLLNIIHGGTLHQDIVNADFHFQPENGYKTWDTLDNMETDSWIARVYGNNRAIEINSIHHQSIDKVGTGIRIIGRSHHDGEVEAIEHESYPHYGVQWHPEYLQSHALFSYFIGRCQL